MGSKPPRESNGVPAEEVSASPVRTDSPEGHSGAVHPPLDEILYLRERLVRTEKALEVLRDILKEETAQREAAVRERDERLVPLYQEIERRDNEVRECRATADHLRNEVDALRMEIDAIHLSKLWPLVRLTGTIRRRLDRRRSS